LGFGGIDRIEPARRQDDDKAVGIVFLLT